MMGVSMLPGIGLKLFVPVIISWVVWRVAKAHMGFVKFYPWDFETIMKGIRPGVSEEVAFRGIAVALLLRLYRRKENIWIPVVFTAVFFGLTHFTNISDFEELKIIAVQAGYATVFGIVAGIFPSESEKCGAPLEQKMA